ncbi:hypothetical protein [Actinospica sp.]|uniref:hypothetical protein n=1 Tax=Actinospica sp. TaxID=1872142 RepID=UPI002CF83DFC|nr:hypothetical protein [Actinospica sp.]HWG24839.1 hypothetical protein [Actinospica sp.]
MKRTIAIAGSLVIAAALGAALCLTTLPDQDPASALTASQADLLAGARLDDYQNGVTAIDATIPVSGQDFRLDGRVDWKAHLGYATLAAQPGQGGGTELLQWTPNGIAVRGSWSGLPPATPPADGWMVRRWQRGADLDTALQLILDLGSDRPESARLLQRSGASVLRRDSIGNGPVTVFAGPPEAPTGAAHTRYWVSDAGTLRRFEALVDGSTTWARVDLAPGSAAPVPHIPAAQ